MPSHYNLVWGRVLMLMFISSLFFYIVNTVVLFFTLPIVSSTELVLLCVVASISLLYTPINTLATHLFPLVQKPQPMVLTNLFGSALSILLTFVLIYFFHLGYWGLVVPGIISGMACNLLFVKFVCKDYHIQPIIERKANRIIEMLKISAPLIPHTLGYMFLTGSATIVLSQLRVSYDEIGLYNHGCSMGSYAVILTTALQTAIVPQVQRAYRSKDFNSYLRLYYLCQTVSLISSICICIWLPEIYSFLIRNEELKQSCSIASLMCFSNVAMAFYSFLSTPAFIEKKTSQLLWLVFIPGMLNFVLCLTFIPIYGYRAAIYSTIIAFWSQLLIPFFVSYYKIRVKTWMGDLRKVIFVLLILLSGLISAQYFSTLSIELKIVLTTCFVMLFVIVYRYQRMYDVI